MESDEATDRAGVRAVNGADVTFSHRPVRHTLSPFALRLSKGVPRAPALPLVTAAGRHGTCFDRLGTSGSGAPSVRETV